jgi:glutathione S-transferase
VTTPVLYHIEVSHYNEKARWALDYKGVPHKRKAPMPMAHMAWAVAMTRGQSKTFPILRLNGDTVHDSTKIIERLERDYPEPPLYPSDPRRTRASAGVRLGAGDVPPPPRRLRGCRLGLAIIRTTSLIP